MAVLPIRTLPDPVLHQKAKRVAKIDGAVDKLIGDMIDTMRAASGIGLAANQVGVPIRLLVIEIPGEGTVALINPRIMRQEGERLVEEGCLSVPGYRGELMRYIKVLVKGLDRTGEEVRYEAEDLLAQAFQHEVDHLNGILYIDRLEGPHMLRRVQAGQEEDEASPDSFVPSTSSGQALRRAQDAQDKPVEGSEPAPTPATAPPA